MFNVASLDKMVAQIFFSLSVFFSSLREQGWGQPLIHIKHYMYALYVWWRNWQERKSNKTFPFPLIQKAFSILNVFKHAYKIFLRRLFSILWSRWRCFPVFNFLIFCSKINIEIKKKKARKFEQHIVITQIIWHNTVFYGYYFVLFN